MTGNELIATFHQHLGSGDLVAFGDLFTAQATMTTMYDGEDGQPVSYVGRDTIVGYFGGAVSVFGPFTFDEVTVHDASGLNNGGTVVAEWRANAEILANGALYRNRFVGVFELTPDGHIGAYRQYRDPNAFERTSQTDSQN